MNFNFLTRESSQHLGADFTVLKKSQPPNILGSCVTEVRD
jgi:hypothetical protein